MSTCRGARLRNPRRKQLRLDNALKIPPQLFSADTRAAAGVREVLLPWRRFDALIRCANAFGVAGDQEAVRGSLELGAQAPTALSSRATDVPRRRPSRTWLSARLGRSCLSGSDPARSRHP